MCVRACVCNVYVYACGCVWMMGWDAFDPMGEGGRSRDEEGGTRITVLCRVLFSVCLALLCVRSEIIFLYTLSSSPLIYTDSCLIRFVAPLPSPPPFSLHYYSSG